MSVATTWYGGRRCGCRETATRPPRSAPFKSSLLRTKNVITRIQCLFRLRILILTWPLLNLLKQPLHSLWRPLLAIPSQHQTNHLHNQIISGGCRNSRIHCPNTFVLSYMHVMVTTGNMSVHRSEKELRSKSRDAHETSFNHLAILALSVCNFSHGLFYTFNPGMDNARAFAILIVPGSSVIPLRYRKRPLQCNMRKQHHGSHPETPTSSLQSLFSLECHKTIHL